MGDLKAFSKSQSNIVIVVCKTNPVSIQTCKTSSISHEFSLLDVVIQQQLDSGHTLTPSLTNKLQGLSNALHCRKQTSAIYWLGVFHCRIGSDLSSRDEGQTRLQIDLWSKFSDMLFWHF